jgi:hypothetical protein
MSLVGENQCFIGVMSLHNDLIHPFKRVSPEDSKLNWTRRAPINCRREGW